MFDRSILIVFLFLHWQHYTAIFISVLAIAFFTENVLVATYALSCLGIPGI